MTLLKFQFDSLFVMDFLKKYFLIHIIIRIQFAKQNKQGNREITNSGRTERNKKNEIGSPKDGINFRK